MSGNVFIVAWRLTKHRDHLDLLIIIKYLVVQSLDDREEIYSTALGRVSGRTGRTYISGGVSYAVGHMLVKKFSLPSLRFPQYFCSFCVQFSSVTQLFPTLCDPMDCSAPGFPVLYQLMEFAQIHVHRVGDAT